MGQNKREVNFVITNGTKGVFTLETTNENSEASADFGQVLMNELPLINSDSQNLQMKKTIALKLSK